MKEDQARKFILAGNAIFTVENTETGNRLTYHVRKADNASTLWFVSVLVGPNNNDSGNYRYLGCIYSDRRYRHGKKSYIAPDAQSAKVFKWIWPRLTGGTLPPQVEVNHAGYCGRCGRLLTVPESVKSGIGPKCAALM